MYGEKRFQHSVIMADILVSETQHTIALQMQLNVGSLQLSGPPGTM